MEVSGREDRARGAARDADLGRSRATCSVYSIVAEVTSIPILIAIIENCLRQPVRWTCVCVHLGRLCAIHLCLSVRVWVCLCM